MALKRILALVLFLGWLGYSGWWLSKTYQQKQNQAKRAAEYAAYLRGPYTPPRLDFPDTREYLKNFHTVVYVGTPKVPPSGIVTLHFHDFYPGDLDWHNGGCTWWDVTKLGSSIEVIPGAKDEESIKATPGHTVRYHCHWSAPRAHPLEYPKAVTQ